MSNEYYGIATPDGRIWWIAEDSSRAWIAFFCNAPAAHHHLPNIDDLSLALLNLLEGKDILSE